MSAQSKRSKGSPSLLLIVIAIAALVGLAMFSSKSPKMNKEKGGDKETAAPTTSQNKVASQSAVSGPVGRNGLRAYAGPGVGEVTLEWQRFFIDGENFNIRYGTKSKEYPYQVQKVGYISTYIVKGLTPGTKYYFVIEGIRTGNVSAGWDGEVSMVAPSSPTVVAVTSGPVGRNLLIGKPGPKKGEVTLNWTRFFPDTEKYHVVYGTTPGKYSYGLLNAVDTTPQDNNYSATIGSLSSGQRYYFALEPQRGGTAIYISSEVSVVAP